MPFDDNDINYLLFNNAEALGEYLFSSWSVQPRQEKDPLKRILVSHHESLHSKLNEQTAYGTVLHCEGILQRCFPNKVKYSQRLNKLIIFSRKVHECYATFLSVLITTLNEPKYSFHPERLLGKNYTYLDYYKTMEKLCSPFKGSYLKYHACVSISRCCMQSHIIYAYLESDLQKLLISDLNTKDFPNERFMYLSSILTTNFWVRTWNETQDFLKSFNGINEILLHEKKPYDSNLIKSVFNHNDELSSEIMKFFQSKITNLLNRAGYQTLDYNEHMALSTLCVENTKKIVPQDADTVNIKTAELTEINETLETLEQYQNERYIVKTKKIEAHLLPLFDVEKNIWLDPICNENSNPHYFLISRLLSRLIDQYDFGQDFQLDDEILYFFRREKVTENKKVVELFIILEPKQLEEFISKHGYKFPIYSNLTVWTYLDIYDREHWLKIIKAKTFVTFLFNSSPFKNFKAWEKQNAFNTHYCYKKFTIMKEEHYVFICKLKTEDNYIFLTPCSLNSISAIIQYLKKIIDNLLFIDDNTFLNKYYKQLNTIINHLLLEERYFDFNAIKKQHES